MLNIKLRLLIACAVLATCAPPADARLPGFHHHAKADAHRGPALVAAANPMAVDAGLEILKKGGKAIDAAVAVQAMLGLVEPPSSGIGGGPVPGYFHAKTGGGQR